MTTKQKSGILLGVSIVGLLGTGIAAIWADRKVGNRKFYKMFDTRDNDEKKEEKEPVKEFVKTYWPYAVPVATAGVTIGVMIFNQSVTSKELTRLAGVAGISIAQLSQYKGAVRKEVGDEVADKIERNMAPIEPASEASISDVLMNNDVDAISCYDELTDTMFECAPTQVLETWLEVNRRVAYGEYVEVNEYLELYGLESKPEFNGLGWNYESVCSHGIYWVQFVPELDIIDDMDVLYIKCVTPIDELSSMEFRR